jgi:hypothetical protein
MNSGDTAVQTPRPRTRAISQSLNSASPPDLAFNPGKRGRVNWASQGPRGLLTQLPSASSPRQTRALQGSKPCRAICPHTCPVRYQAWPS